MRTQPAIASQRATTSPAGSGEGNLPPGERAVLIAAVQYGGVDLDQLSVLTGYKRSSRDAYILRLTQKGLITKNGGTIHPTDSAVSALGSDYEPLPVGAGLQDYWRQRLPEGERKTLEVAIAHYPQYVARETISEQTGYRRSSRDAYIQRLKARRLVEVGREGITASANIF